VCASVQHTSAGLPPRQAPTYPRSGYVLTREQQAVVLGRGQLSSIGGRRSAVSGACIARHTRLRSDRRGEGSRVGTGRGPLVRFRGAGRARATQHNGADRWRAKVHVAEMRPAGAARGRAWQDVPWPGRPRHRVAAGAQAHGTQARGAGQRHVRGYQRRGVHRAREAAARRRRWPCQGATAVDPGRRRPQLRCWRGRWQGHGCAGAVQGRGGPQECVRMRMGCGGPHEIDRAPTGVRREGPPWLPRGAARQHRQK